MYPNQISARDTIVMTLIVVVLILDWYGLVRYLTLHLYPYLANMCTIITDHHILDCRGAGIRSFEKPHSTYFLTDILHIYKKRIHEIERILIKIE